MDRLQAKRIKQLQGDIERYTWLIEVCTADRERLSWIGCYVNDIDREISFYKIKINNYQMELSRLTRELEAHCESLDSKHGDVVRLRYLHGQQIKDIGKRLGYSVSRIKGILAEAWQTVPAVEYRAEDDEESKKP